MKYLISIVGPTAAGKTGFALELARKFRAPVISADSRQVYKGMDIGTAKPRPEEIEGIPHYFFDEIEPSHSISAGEFGDRVDALLDELFTQQFLVLLVGGSGFYLQAVWEGLNEFPEVAPEIRETLNREMEEGGLEPLVQELKTSDPATWASIDRKNPVRVIRALEIFRATGEPISTFRTGPEKKEKNYRDIKLGLTMDRPVLYDRINHRVDMMMAHGLLDEVRGLLEKYGDEAPGLQSVGYIELVAYLKGECSLEEAVRLIKRNSRRLAKRQYTWFRRFPDIAWFESEEHRDMERHVFTQMGLE